MRPDTRQPFTYRGVTVSPQQGAPRYFGSKHGQYLRRWWRLLLGPMSWVLVPTKAEARIFIETRT